MAGTFEIVVAVVSVSATIVNIAWTIYIQRQRWTQEGAVIDVRPRGLFNVDRQEFAVLEVRNLGRGRCTVAEVGYLFEDGVQYGYYAGRTNEGYPEDDSEPPLPHTLEGGRRAEWRMKADIIRGAVMNAAHWERLRLYLELETGERYTTLPPINPPRFE